LLPLLRLLPSPTSLATHSHSYDYVLEQSKIASAAAKSSSLPIHEL